MINLIVELSKYLLLILAALYTLESFSVFKYKAEDDKRYILRKQLIVIFFMDFVAFLVIFLKTEKMEVIYFFGAQLLYFIVVQVLYRIFYKKASLLLLNHMCMLLSVGFIMLARLDTESAVRQFQIVVIATVIAMVIPVMIRKLTFLNKWTWFYAGAGMLLLLVVLVLGKNVNGAKINISLGGFAFQPSEFAKVAVILLLTYVITNSEKRQDSLLHMAGTMALLLPIVGLVGTNNLSTAIIILGIGVILIFVSNPKYLPFVGIGGVGVLFIGIFLSMASYRLERIAIWRNPEKYEKGFQTIQGLYAIGSGGIFGKGLGSSLQKLGFVPEAQNDMIFSIICEETGLIGACLLILVFALLIWRLMVIATHARDLCGALIAAGIMGHMAIQVILNIAVVTNTIPNTGITLPFVSYGGTSVLFLMGEMGLALSVSRTRSP